MGTGMVSILLFDIPYQKSWLYWLSVGIFLLNVLLFVMFLIPTILRYTLYTPIIPSMLQDLGQSLFISTIPMGLSTIISMLVQVGEPFFGQSIVTLAWILWWIEIVLSIACCVTIPFLIMYAHNNDLQSMTAAWLLPVVTTVVASATGGLIAGYQSNPQHALWTLTTSYILWGCGMSLALSILVIYLMRLFLHKFPPKHNIVSCFIALGPLGQGAYSIQKLGAVARKIFIETNTLDHANTGSGNIMYTAGFMIALLLWGLAMVWLAVAIIHLFSSRFPFNMVMPEDHLFFIPSNHTNRDGGRSPSHSEP